MSENQNPSGATNNPPTQETDEFKPQVLDKGVYTLEENQFGGALEGLRYFVLQFKTGTDEEANNSVKAIVGQPEIKDAAGNVIQPKVDGKWNNKQILAIVNSAIRSAQRVKAQQEILSEEKDKQPQLIVKRLQTNKYLLSAEDSEKWVPGERELTIQGLMRKAADLTSKGDKEGALKLMMEAQAQMVEQLAQQAAEQAQASNS